MRRGSFFLKPRVKENPYGTHDRDAFYADNQFPLRCPKCDKFMDHNFTFEGKCPNCNYRFTKKEARDMVIEAYQVNAVQTNKLRGWTQETRELLQGKETPQIMAPDGTTRDVDWAARSMMATAMQLKRRQKRVQKIKVGNPLLYGSNYGRKVR